MVECDQRDLGCNGGNLNRAWKYLEKTGIVTDKCLPYSSGDGKSGLCPTTCENSAVPYEKYKCEYGSIVTARTPEAIKSQIYNYGPMETAFTVYSDFMSYGGGVYTHTAGHMEGGHAVKILGWGHE
jgi:cathepsin B